MIAGRPASTSRAARVSAAVLVGVALLAAFRIFRCESHLLGDGLLLLSDVDRIVPDRIWTRSFDPLWLVLIGIVHEAGRPFSAGPDTAFRLTSYVSGLAYVAMAVLFVRGITRSAAERVFGISALLTLASVQLFCGYVESYGVVAAVTMAWLYLGFRPSLSPRALPLMGAFVGIAGLFHVSCLSFVPSLVVLAAMVGNDRSPGVRIRTGVFTLASMLFFLSFGAVLLDLQWTAPGALRASHALPIHGPLDRFAAYHLLSPAHGYDLVNLALLTCPLACILAPTSLPGLRSRDRTTAFLAAMVAGTAGFVFLANPEIGFFRDWDLLSLSSIPFTCLVLAGMARLRDRPRWSSWWRGIVLIAVFASTASWIWLNASPSLAESRSLALMRSTALSVHARAYGWESIGTYKRLRTHDVQAAAGYYHRAVQADPDNPRLHDLVGVAESELGQVTRALDHLRTAVRLSRGRDSRYLDNLAAVQSAAGAHDDAVRTFRRGLHLDPRSPLRYRNLGLALINAGALTAARDTLAIAVVLAPDDSLTAVVLDRLRAATTRSDARAVPDS